MFIKLLLILAVAAFAAGAAIFLSRKKRDNLAGFVYDPVRDIFFTAKDAWQRRFGYCQAYDEAAVLFNMVIDCEPIRFSYGGKSWLIELWKGQYGMTTGAEIGVYYTRRRVGDSERERDKAFYKCVKDADMLPMSIVLLKNGRELFSLNQKHWWLTGFVLGEFSYPSELRAIFGITFPDEKMKCAFTSALLDLGYDNCRFDTDGLTVKIVFSEPFSKQPSTLTPIRVREAESVNRELCEIWGDVTGGMKNSEDKLEFVRKHNPELYEKAVSFGKVKRARHG